MPAQCRIGDKSAAPLHSHGCPACPHAVVGPATSGSPNVFVNGKPALRATDQGTHTVCCGTNTWKATAGSATVFINGLPAHRVGDANLHCNIAPGKMVEGSPTVITG